MRLIALLAALTLMAPARARADVSTDANAALAASIEREAASLEQRGEERKTVGRVFFGLSACFGVAAAVSGIVLATAQPQGPGDSDIGKAVLPGILLMSAVPAALIALGIGGEFYSAGKSDLGKAQDLRARLYIAPALGERAMLRGGTVGMAFRF
jgi:hypothetical protein